MLSTRASFFSNAGSTAKRVGDALRLATGAGGTGALGPTVAAVDGAW
jgi:hypothetical protein